MATKASEAGVGEQVLDKTKMIGNDFVEIGRLVKDAVAEKLEELGQGALSRVQKGRDRAVEFRDGASGAIENRPLTAVIIAAGIGFLIGLLGRRR